MNGIEKLRFDRGGSSFAGLIEPGLRHLSNA